MNVPSETWREVFRRDRGICRYCGVSLLETVSSYFSATVDHVVPRAAGGGDESQNLVCCCPACNSMLSRQRSLQSIDERKSFIARRHKEETKNLIWWREELGKDRTMTPYSPQQIDGLLRRFYDIYGMPDEGPPDGVDLTQVVSTNAVPLRDITLLEAAVADETQLRQFTRCREVLEDLATRMAGDELLRELSSVAEQMDEEFEEALAGVLWFAMAASLDQRQGELPVTPFDSQLDIPLPVKMRLTVEGSLVLRLYLALVYMREGVLNRWVARGARSGLPCCGRVCRLLNSDYVRRIRNALSHGTFSSCIAGIGFRDDRGTIVATPGFMNWLSTWLMLIQLQGLAAMSRESAPVKPGDSEQ